ncbi:hypothetical protein O181_001921 [Austropuccinia psidii MF-1]|uniref:Uncharacterized protein n=1 Tax=Austropuccinia psidii MF-1 TaxID=1389203 RepID=A0A9Q3GCV3_9BASI|nr:hypothetical protein [Austropuccinia psidii MF-1]
MSPVHLSNLSFQRNQPEDRECLSRARGPGRGHLGRSDDWKAMDQVLQLHQLLKDLFKWSMDNMRLNLAFHWEELGARFQKICLKEIDFKELMVITKGWNTTRKFRLLEVRENRIMENQATIQDQWPRATILHNPRRLPGEDKDTRAKKDHLQPEEERVRPKDPEAVGFGERIAQEPEVVLMNSIISSPSNRNITPTQLEYNVVTPESNLKGYSLWFQMFQYVEKTQKQISELEESQDRMKILTAAMDKIVKNLQERHAQLRKASKEANKRLNLVSEEQHHITRDRDCLDQDINKLFNVCHSMKPQPQGHVMDNPYHQDDIKPDAMLMNQERSPSKYQDGDNMSHSENKDLKKLPETSSWPKFSGTGEYDHMELLDYIDGLFIDIPSIPD